MIPTRAVKAVIIQDNKLLLLKGSVHSLWDLPGGLIDDGESELEALKREIREELTCVCDVGEKLGSWSFFRHKDKETVTVQNYACRLHGEPQLSDEHTELQWVAVESLHDVKVKDDSFFQAISNNSRN